MSEATRQRKGRDTNKAEKLPSMRTSVDVIHRIQVLERTFAIIFCINFKKIHY